MTDDHDPIIRRKRDPLGYDTNRPFDEVAREMAADAIAGRDQDAVDAELEAVRRQWRMVSARNLQEARAARDRGECVDIEEVIAEVERIINDD